MSDVEETSKDPESQELPDEHPVPSPTLELEGRRRAAAVLEVLGGAMTPSEAAEALGVTLATYYLLEGRALEGLVAACEPRSRGRSAAPGKSILALKRENERLKQDLSRTQAIARAVQRAAGIQIEDGDSTGGHPRRHRRPHARALRAARELAPSSSLPPPSSPPQDPGGPATSTT
jgi:hypothetical protein